MQPGIRWGSLRVRIVVWTFVPTAIILVAVALVTFAAYQQVAEDLIIERNQEVARLAAGQFATDLTGYADLLAAESRREEIYQHGPEVQANALRDARNRLVIFDGGVVILDTYGTVVAAEPGRDDALWQDWSDRSYYRQMISSPGTIFSDIVADGPDNAEVIVVAVPITGSQGEFLGVMAGMFRLDAATSAFYGDIVRRRIGVEGSAYLVDGAGRVIYHSDLGNVGDDFASQEAVGQVLSGQTGAILTRDVDGLESVVSYAPVPGTTWGLVTQENWAALISPNQGYRRTLLLLLVLGVVIPALVVAWGVRRITKPIQELGHAAQEVARGNFGQTITARTGDEIEELADQFNLMSGQLQESYTQLEQQVVTRTKELAVLNAIAATVNQSHDLGKILNDALNETLQVMGIDTGGIYLLDEEAEVLTVAAQRGFKPHIVTEIDKLKVGEGFSGRVIQTGQPMVISDASHDQRLSRMVVREEGLRSLAVVPLSSKGKILGTLFTVTHDNRDFTDQDVQLLTSIAYQIGVAVENAYLFKQARQVAVMDERQRLARDLHDSVTQALYGVTLYAEAAARLLASQDTNVELAADHVRDLQATAQEALREMRLLIFELRPPLLEQEGLAAALQTRLESVEARSGLKIDFVAEGDEGQLSSEVEMGMYRIAQEALNNTLKHAQANSVSVTLRQDKQCVTLEITDDGVGFDPATARGKGGLGLPGIEERAAELGGQLTIKSSPGQGTSVRVEIH